MASGAVLAAPVPAATSASEWAYGAVRTVTFSGIDGAGHTYHGSATYGFTVILNATSTTSAGGVTNTTLHLNRTIGALITAEYCLGGCSGSTELANFSYHAWEVVNAWANLTTGGTVTLAGVGSVPALALENSSESVQAFLRESVQVGHGAVPARYESLFVNLTGDAAVTLTPALGLFPVNASELVAGAAWNSSSAYAATGSVHYSDWVSKWGTAVLAPENLTSSGSDSLAGNGTVALAGSYPAGSAFTYDRTSFPALNLTITGPFSLREGVLLVPADADLFSGGTHPWSASQNGSSVVTTAFVDVHPGGSYNGHLPIVASSAAWVSAASDASSVIPTSTPLGVDIEPAAGNATVVQGQPESIDQATSDQACLVRGVGCGSSGPALPWVRLAIAGGVVVVVAGVLAVALVSRRKMPPPAYPNAQLYPPGAPTVSRPTPVRPAPKPAEDDPLGHLW